MKSDAVKGVVAREGRIGLWKKMGSPALTKGYYCTSAEAAQGMWDPSERML